MKIKNIFTLEYLVYFLAIASLFSAFAFGNLLFWGVVFIGAAIGGIKNFSQVIFGFLPFTGFLLYLITGSLAWCFLFWGTINYKTKKTIKTGKTKYFLYYSAVVQVLLFFGVSFYLLLFNFILQINIDLSFAKLIFIFQFFPGLLGAILIYQSKNKFTITATQIKNYFKSDYVSSINLISMKNYSRQDYIFDRFLICLNILSIYLFYQYIYQEGIDNMKDILEQQAEFVFDINQTMLTFSSLPVTVSWTLLVLWLFMHNNLQKFSFIKTKFLLLMFIVFISIFYAYLIAIQYFSNQSYNSVFFLCLSAMIFAVPLFTSYLLMNSKVRSIFTVREK